jgi:GNAT superfamily N-acetyltransferase
MSTAHPTTNGQVSLEKAIEIFARAFAFTRSFTYPAHAERVGRLWVIRDASRKRSRDYRGEEWVAFRVDPVDVDSAVRQRTRGRYRLCIIHASDELDAPIRDAYRALGYRLGTTEALMVHDLRPITRCFEPFPVQRILTQDLADRVARVARSRQALPEHLISRSTLRLYAAFDGNQPIGWARNVAVGGATWVSSVFVTAKYRRRGIASAMLTKMLRDDRASGSKCSTLLASHAGAKLYPNLGYEQIGTLLVYTPKRS